MGIKQLHTFLRKLNPSIYQTKHFRDLENKRLAIDASIFMCRFKSSLGTRWLNGFFSMLEKMKKYSIKVIFIFDGVRPPLEKTKEKETRVISRKKNRNKIESIIEEWSQFEHMYDSNVVNIPLSELQDKTDFLYDFMRKKVNGDRTEMTREEIVHYITKLQRNLVPISSDDYRLLKSMLNLMGIAHMTSIDEQEAEGLGSLLTNLNITDALLTEDTDCIAYSCDVFYFGIDFSKEIVMELRLEKVLEVLQFERKQLLDFCILLGTDYNKNLNKVGPMKAFDYIKKYKNLETISTLMNTDSLNFPRVRQLFDSHRFKDMLPLHEISCHDPFDHSPVELQKFCFYNNVKNIYN